jgi:hypothetical protein
MNRNGIVLKDLKKLDLSNNIGNNLADLIKKDVAKFLLMLVDYPVGRRYKP